MYYNLIENKPDNEQVLLDSKGKIISKDKQDIVSVAEHTNGVIIAKKHIKSGSEALKKTNPNRAICHILDQEYDNETIFEHITALKDSFVIRLKLNCLSNLLYFKHFR